MRLLALLSLLGAGGAALAAQPPVGAHAARPAHVAIMANQGATNKMAVARRISVPARKEDEGGPTLPPLTVSGLGADHVIDGSTLVFRLSRHHRLDLAKDSNGLIQAHDSRWISLKPYWRFDPADNSFTIDGVRMQQLLDALPDGLLEVSVNFVSADGEFAAVYEFTATRATRQRVDGAAR